MPVVKGKILNSWVENGKFLSKIQVNRRLLPKGIFVELKWGAKRSSMQNAFYWEYLTFLWEDCNLKEEYLTLEELHETLKATFLSERIITKSGLEIIKVGSTTALDKIQFAEYLDKIDKAMGAYHQINTAPFWETYERDFKI
jgi:hypothetical protein